MRKNILSSKQEQCRYFSTEKMNPTLLRSIITLLIVCLGLLILTACGQDITKQIAQLEEEYANEINELVQNQQIELRQSYDAGFQEGYEQALEQDQESVFLEGKRQGYAEGISEVVDEAAGEANVALNQIRERNERLERTINEQNAELAELKERLASEGSAGEANVALNQSREHNERLQKTINDRNAELAQLKVRLARAESDVNSLGLLVEIANAERAEILSELVTTIARLEECLDELDELRGN